MHFFRIPSVVSFPLRFYSNKTSCHTQHFLGSHVSRSHGSETSTPCLAAQPSSTQKRHPALSAHTLSPVNNCRLIGFAKKWFPSTSFHRHALMCPDTAVRWKCTGLLKASHICCNVLPIALIKLTSVSGLLSNSPSTPNTPALHMLQHRPVRRR